MKQQVVWFQCMKALQNTYGCMVIISSRQKIWISTVFTTSLNENTSSKWSKTYCTKCRLLTTSKFTKNEKIIHYLYWALAGTWRNINYTIDFTKCRNATLAFHSTMFLNWLIICDTTFKATDYFSNELSRVLCNHIIPSQLQTYTLRNWPHIFLCNTSTSWFIQVSFI